MGESRLGSQRVESSHDRSTSRRRHLVFTGGADEQNKGPKRVTAMAIVSLLQSFLLLPRVFRSEVDVLNNVPT